MIDVMKRLAELDESNPRVVKAQPLKNDNTEKPVTGFNKYTGNEVFETISVKELQKLSGLTESIEECGMPGMMPGMMPAASQTPASFSINASAANGTEVSTMLRDILNLAGVKEVSPDMISQRGSMDMPAHAMDKPLTGEPPAGDIERAIKAIDAADGEENPAMDMDQDDDESFEPTMDTDFAPNMGGETSQADPEADIQGMVGDVKDMTDTLKNTDEEDLNMAEAARLYDNSPSEHIREYDPNDFAQVINKIRNFDVVPARSGDNPIRSKTAESVTDKSDNVVETLASKLYAEFQGFKK